MRSLHVPVKLRRLTLVLNRSPTLRPPVVAAVMPGHMDGSRRSCPGQDGLGFRTPTRRSTGRGGGNCRGRGSPVGAVLDFQLHLIRLHRLAAHGALRPAPRSAPCATRLRRWQLSTLDGFPGFLAQGGLVVHLAGLVVQWADASRPTPRIRVLTEQEPSITPIRTSNRSGRICGRKEKSARDDTPPASYHLSGDGHNHVSAWRRSGRSRSHRHPNRAGRPAAVATQWRNSPNRMGENCGSRTAPAPPSARSPTDEPEANHPAADERQRGENDGEQRTSHGGPHLHSAQSRPGPEPAGVAVRALH
jgi:hypothetical protein